MLFALPWLRLCINKWYHNVCCWCYYRCCLVINILMTQYTTRKRKENLLRPLTWTRDSGNLILHATSSRIKMSGYRVFPNKSSKTSNCPRVNVVRSLRCFLVLTPMAKMRRNARKIAKMLKIIFVKCIQEKKSIEITWNLARGKIIHTLYKSYSTMIQLFIFYFIQYICNGKIVFNCRKFRERFQLVVFVYLLFFYHTNTVVKIHLLTEDGALWYEKKRKKKFKDKYYSNFGSTHLAWAVNTHPLCLFNIKTEPKSNEMFRLVWDCVLDLFVCASERYNAYHLLRGVDFI